jgi:AAHS family 3-hydroxyphenylpropionic acid transporter
MPFGGMMVPLIALALGPDFDWRVIFWIGGVAPLAIGAAMYARLGESPEFAAARSTGKEEHARVSAILFGAGRAAATISLWLVSLATLIVLYLLLNWLPYLLAGMGFAPAQVAMIAFAFTVGGGFGALVLGFALGLAGRRATLLIANLAIPGLLIAFTQISAFGLLAPVAFGLGFFVIGSQFLIYGILPVYYPVQMRGTGVDWGVAVGRVGAVLGPLIAGRMLEGGASAQDIVAATIPAICLALAAIVVLLFFVRAQEA